MEYTLLEVDIDKCIIKTMEGKSFRIKPYEISVTMSWTPTATLIYDKKESTLEYEPSGQIVRIV